MDYAIDIILFTIHECGSTIFEIYFNQAIILPANSTFFKDSYKF